LKFTNSGRAVLDWFVTIELFLVVLFLIVY